MMVGLSDGMLWSAAATDALMPVGALMVTSARRKP